MNPRQCPGGGLFVGMVLFQGFSGEVTADLLPVGQILTMPQGDAGVGMEAWDDGILISMYGKSSLALLVLLYWFGVEKSIL